MKATKLAYKGHSLPTRFSDHAFLLATIGIYYAMGVPFGEGFLPTSDTSGHLCTESLLVKEESAKKAGLSGQKARL